VIGPELAHELVTAYLGATFTGEERHQRRLQKIYALEGRYSTRAQHVEKGTP
jgi:ribose 5-phosphate isomerase B